MCDNGSKAIKWIFYDMKRTDHGVQFQFYIYGNILLFIIKIRIINTFINAEGDSVKCLGQQRPWGAHH